MDTSHRPETPDRSPDTALCAHCGRPRNEHWMVNYSDGPLLGRPALLCPRSHYAPLHLDDPS